MAVDGQKAQKRSSPKKNTMLFYADIFPARLERVFPFAVAFTLTQSTLYQFRGPITVYMSSSDDIFLIFYKPPQTLNSHHRPRLLRLLRLATTVSIPSILDRHAPTREFAAKYGLPMSDAPAASHELKEKKLFKKGRKLSKVFKDDFKRVEANARSFEPEPSAQDGTSEKLARTNLPHLHESLGPITENNGRRNSSLSGHSLLTGENPTSPSLEPASQSAIPSADSAEQSDKGKTIRASRQIGENIPPIPTKRRQSLDFNSRAASPQNLKRSSSLWAQQHQRQWVLDDAAGEFQERYARNFGTGTMSERQRALNVKRARKMAQVFGQEPPSELIHINDERESDHFRDSTVTLSTSLAVTPPLRNRANSTSSSGTMATGDEAEAEVPPTPPPFSTATDDAPEASDSAPTDSFQDRRRRAAKLSRFFGVGFRDILQSPETVPLPDARVQVDVKVTGRRFWGFNDRSKNDDMEEAIQKLRGLKAS